MTQHVITKIVYLLVGIVVILAVTYLFGYDLLEGYIKGNDSPFAYTAAKWVDRWGVFNQPRWFPLQGAGVSLIQGTHIGSLYLTHLFNKISPLDLSQAFKLLSFLSVFLTALGIYFFVRVKFKNQTAALIAGAFYPMSQAVWSWITDIGLYANALSFIFVPLAFLFSDLYLNKVLEGKYDFQRKIWLVFASLSLGLTLIFHLVTGIFTIFALFLYLFLSSLIFSKKGFLRLFKKGIAAFLAISLLAFLAFSFLIFPQIDYIKNAARNTTRSLAFEQINFTELPVLFGFKLAPTPPNEAWYSFFASSILILAAVGIIFGFFRKRKLILPIAFLFLFFLFFSGLPQYWPWLVKKLLFSFLPDSYQRTIFIPMIFLPILASFGAMALAKLISNKLFKKIKFSNFMFSGLIILIALTFIVFLRHIPPGDRVPCYFGYGMSRNTSIDYCHFWQKLKNIAPVSKLEAPFSGLVKELVANLKVSSRDRLDISPSLGYLATTWNTYSDSSLVGVYWYHTTLNNIFWGYQQSAFYGKKEEPNFEEISNLAKYWGINYVVLDSQKDPRERFKEELWQKIFSKDNIEVKKFKESISLASLTKKSSILVLGRFNKRAYEQVFRTANAGALPYNQALLIEGKDSGRIDDYSLQELKNFDIVFLYGYTYKDKEKAWRLLKDYVKEGGSLFIETGWQYVNPDWRLEETPDLYPLKKLEWKEFGKAWDNNLILEGQEITEINLSNFSPPIWQDLPWGFSTSEKENLRAGFQSIISVNNHPLVAFGNYGEGKIVWSGMNLVGHAYTYGNPEEQKLISDLSFWLKQTSLNTEISNVQIKRDYPDKVEFLLSQPTENTTSLYWRETYYPDWKADLERCQMQDLGCKKEKIEVLRAGPNMMLMRIPPIEGRAKITLELKQSLIHIFSKIISALTLILIILWLFKEKLFWKIVSPIYNLLRWFPRFLVPKKAKEWWAKEDE